MMTPDREIILNTAEAAAFLKIPKRTLEGWRYRGEGPAFCRYNHSSVRYKLSDLIAFLESKRVDPSDGNESEAAA